MEQTLIPSAFPFEDLQAFVAIVFSAVTYLIDFSSNVATAHEYHHMVEVNPSWIGIFIGMLSVMAIAHIANAVIFKLELKKEDQPLKTAYLFPLMQLSRLVRALWRTCSWKGLGNLKAEDQNTLYSILSVSLETGPQLTLQFVVFVLYYKKSSGQPPTTLLVSIMASFLSGSVNGGLAILAVSYDKARNTPPSWRVKLVGFITSALFTISALFLQCWIYTVQMTWAYDNGYPIAAYITTQFSFYFILYMVLLRRRGPPSASRALTAYCNGKRLVHCAALSYLSAKIGPLQPLTSDARAKDELGKVVYWYRLILVSSVHLCLYAGVFLLSWIGPPHLRWSRWCPTRLAISPTDAMMGFPCRWYIPAIISGALMYSLTVASHIVMDYYVNKKVAKEDSFRIYPDHDIEEAAEAEMESTSQSDSRNGSIRRQSNSIECKEAQRNGIRESDLTDKPHSKVYGDVLCSDGGEIENGIRESDPTDKPHSNVCGDVLCTDGGGIENGCLCSHPVASFTAEAGEGEMEGVAQTDDSNVMHAVEIREDGAQTGSIKESDTTHGAEISRLCNCLALSATPEARVGEVEGAALMNSINSSMHDTESHTKDNGAEINPSIHTELHTKDNAAEINPLIHTEPHTKDNHHAKDYGVDNTATN